MADPIVVSQLIAKRSELAGLIDAKRGELNALLENLVSIGVEQRQLLAAMNDVATVVDIEDDSIRLLLAARAPLVDQRKGQPHNIPNERRILQARDRRLRAMIKAAVRQPTTGELEGRILAQVIEIIAVLIAAADRENAGPKEAIQRMRYPVLITIVGKQTGKPFDNPDTLEAKASSATPPFDDSRPPSKGGDHLLRLDGWQGERQQRIVGHGGYGRLGDRRSFRLSNEFLRHIIALRHIRQPLVHKTGWRAG